MHATWVEIPVRDIERALKFYQALFEADDVQIVEEGGVRRIATFVSPNEGGRAGLSLNQTANFEPMRGGVLVYLDAGEDLSTRLPVVESAGGTIVEGKTSMGAAGNYATFLDTEGNLLALYSYK